MDVVKIRKATIDDYSSIINLYKQLYDAEKVFDNNLIRTYKVDEKQEKEIKKRIRSRKEIFLVSEIDSKIVGLVDGYILESIYYKEKVAYLDHLCVDKKHRNNEIGTLLIKEFCDISKKKGAKFVKLNAFEGNKNAVSLYKKLGFKKYSAYYINEIQ